MLKQRILGEKEDAGQQKMHLGHLWGSTWRLAQACLGPGMLLGHTSARVI